MASPKEGFAGFTLNLPVSLHSRLKAQAAFERRSMTEIIDNALRNYLTVVEGASAKTQAHRA